MYTLLYSYASPFKEICYEFLFILFFINVITSNRNQPELTRNKLIGNNILGSLTESKELNHQPALWKGKRQGTSGDPNNSCSQTCLFGILPLT